MLPAQMAFPSQPSRGVIIFIMGGTPYDEHGNTGGSWDDNCVSIVEHYDFYPRFIGKIRSMGYAVATMAKRNFTYPCMIPRPCLNDFALDILFLISEMKTRNLISDENDVILIGHSEGSIVATKVLNLVQRQPAGCILLGSASLAFNYMTDSWETWYYNDIMKKVSNFSDKQIREIFELYKKIHTDIQYIDENTFETVWKKNKEPIDVAPWESYRCIREFCYYNPVPNLLTANIPVLFCTGENDTSMPLVLAERTYQQLLDMGFGKATFKAIPDVGHEYENDAVFTLIDAWITTIKKTD